MDVSEVEKCLHPLATDWQQLGRELGLVPSLLERIAQESESGEMVECLKKVIKEWASLNPSWGRLTGSLQRLQMDYIAAQIESSHGEELLC